jgi:hypothetical protein
MLKLADEKIFVDIRGMIGKNAVRHQAVVNHIEDAVLLQRPLDAFNEFILVLFIVGHIYDVIEGAHPGDIHLFIP